MSDLRVEDMKLWLANPVTKKFAIILKKSRLSLLDQLATAPETFSDHSMVLGMCKGVEAVVDKLEFNLKDNELIDELVGDYYKDILTNEQSENELSESE